MKIAYLFFSYKNPALLWREIQALTTPDTDFYLHIDGKSNLDDFKHIQGEHIHFSNQRRTVYWAEFTSVEAILSLMRQARDSGERYDYLVLLSGSDYPLRSGAAIQKFFAEHHGDEFLNCVKMPNLAAGKPLWKINTIRYQSLYPIRKFLWRALNKLGPIVQRDYRRHLGPIEPYSGNTWWALTREACEYALDYVARNPHYSEYFKKVYVPEECFLHTILGSSPFRDRIKRNLIFEDWSARGSHPALIAERHMAQLEAPGPLIFSDVYGSGEMLFARKFSDETLHLVDRLDRAIRANEQQASTDRPVAEGNQLA